MSHGHEVQIIPNFEFYGSVSTYNALYALYKNV
jgi:hypothetical protein